MQKRAKKPTKMSTASWRTEVRRFCDTTSVKGVPKLMRARGPIRRALWTSCVLLGAAMATYQSYILLKVYCDFETSTSVEFINRDASFPDVTICKTNPPPDINVGNLTIEEYLKEVDNIMNQGNSAQDQAAIRYLQGHSGYYQNVVVRDNHVQDALKNFVLNCTYVLWNEEMQTCNATKFWWRFLTPAYPGCITFKVIDTPANLGRLRTLSLILYLNNFETRDITDFDIYPLVTYSTGARVFVSSPGRFPDLGRVILAPPGRETIIQVNEVRRRRARWPYSNCRAVPDYHHRQCMDECVQNSSVSHCKCLDLTIPTTPKARETTDFCGKLDTKEIFKLVDKLNCRQNYGTPQVYMDCERICPPECVGTTYHHRQMSAPWPHHSRHLAFHRDLVQYQSYSEKFSTYNHIRNISSTDPDPKKGAKMLENTTLISDNFLKVMVSMEFSDVMEYNDMPLTSPSALTGSLGAVLNLWSGVTFVTLVEVIDLLYSLCTVTWDRQKNNSHHAQNQDQQQTVNLHMSDL